MADKQNTPPRPAKDQDILHGRIVPQHLSGDDPELDEIDSASADSFPASDPPSQSAPALPGGAARSGGRQHQQRP